jgi:hypothetical protein
MDPTVAVASRAATVLLDKWVLLMSVFSNYGCDERYVVAVGGGITRG